MIHPNPLVALSASAAKPDKGTRPPRPRQIPPILQSEKRGAPSFFFVKYPHLRTTMAGLELPTYDMPSLVTPSSLIRSQDIWFDDGNVVIQADNILFKVFRGILASNSTVFSDMFSVPQPTNASVTDPDVYDSCPLVKIHDTPEDTKHFLKAIHDAGSVQFRS